MWKSWRLLQSIIIYPLFKCYFFLIRLLQTQFIKGASTVQLIHEHASVFWNSNGLLPVRYATDGIAAWPLSECQSPADLRGQHHLPRPHSRHKQMLAHSPNPAQWAGYFLCALLRLLWSKHIHSTRPGCRVRHQPDACFRQWRGPQYGAQIKPGKFYKNTCCIASLLNFPNYFMYVEINPRFSSVLHCFLWAIMFWQTYSWSTAFSILWLICFCNLFVIFVMDLKSNLR